MTATVPPGNYETLPHASMANAVAAWRDPKRYLWLLGSTVPCQVIASWLLVLLTGQPVFWWTGAFLSFVLMPVLDYYCAADTDNPPEDVLRWLEEDRFYRWATYLYLPNQFVSLALTCWLWAGGGWVTMTAIDKVGLMVTVGIIGGVAINAAHELGHKRTQLERRLSKIALAQTWYGHFYVEHNRGHHARVATVEDPATARMGESLYRFLPRSVLGGLRSAWSLESRRFANAGRTRWSWRNDILGAWALSAVLFTVLALWFGPGVLPLLAGQAVVGFCLLETVNYLEHYGLRRVRRPGGRYEPVNATHSWNSSAVVANVFLFHLQRHSDHHANPARRYQTLRHAAEAPQLPSGYGSMMVLACLPPLWRRVMDPRVLDHYDGDIHRTGLSPRHAKSLPKRYRRAAG